MFGVICAGRPVQANLQQVDANKYVFQIENGAKVNHMVLFLLPEAKLPGGMAASVYFQLPGKDFQPLGFISNDKPSAIFKINANATSVDIDMDNQMVDDDTVEQFDINVGISIEPLENVQQQQQLAKKPPPAVGGTTPATSGRTIENPNDIAVLANKIVQHAYNFLSGFTTPDGKVPMKAFDDWWAKFKHKLDMNPKFLDNLD